MEPETTVYQDFITSPVGYWTISASSKGLTAIDFSIEQPVLSHKSNELTLSAKEQLAAYFAKKRKDFDLPLDLDKHPPFFLAVWKELQNIQFGAMTSYGTIALNLNNPKAVRAVGMANGKNPLPLIIPCHRVIGKNRSLTGYAHGLEVKRWLLEHEGAIASTPTLF